MEVIIAENSNAASLKAALVVAKLVREKPSAVLGLATGSTPLALYKELINMHKNEGLDFSKITTFNLDEYVDLSPEHDQSYHFFMWENFFKHINIKKENVNIPDGMAGDVKAFCKEYEAKILACGGIDLQVLGIGSDGHIAFNEPSSSLTSRTRLKVLTQSTIQDNARFFADIKDVPRRAITMGVGTILDAKMCVLLAFGKSKAKAVFDMIEGPISAMCPASALQNHQRTKIFIDEDAASKLQLKDYFKHSYALKPDAKK